MGRERIKKVGEPMKNMQTNFIKLVEILENKIPQP